LAQVRTKKQPSRTSSPHIAKSQPLDFCQLIPELVVIMAFQLSLRCMGALSVAFGVPGVLSAGGCSENQAFARACGMQCYSNPARASCASTCLQGKGVPQSCASCQGAKIDCTISKCLTPCAASATGPECQTCVRTHCRSCSGAGAFLDAATPTGFFEEAVMAGVADAKIVRCKLHCDWDLTACSWQ